MEMKEQRRTTKEADGRVAHLSLFVCLSSARLVFGDFSTHDKDGGLVRKQRVCLSDFRSLRLFENLLLTQHFTQFGFDMSI